MGEHGVVEGTATEIGTDEQAERQVGQEIVRPSTLGGVIPVVKATELVERLDVIREAMDSAMQRDVDYGVIPGTNKPTLLKPGAEKLSVLFQLDVQLGNEKMWGPGDHLTVISHATAYHVPSGARLGYGEGVCSTRERKYTYRKQERMCPKCSKPAVIAGKAEYGGGWLCWRKHDGCGAKFSAGDPSVENQVVGEIDNPDLPDLYNTVVKMAQKRARVDVVLAVTGASALFTQDVEDAPTPSPPPKPISEAQARELYDAAVAVVDSMMLQRAVAHLAGRDPGELGERDEAASQMASVLSADTALRLAKWIADKAAKREEATDAG